MTASDIPEKKNGKVVHDEWLAENVSQPPIQEEKYTEEDIDALWNELGKYIHGGESFTWYPHTLRYLKETYNLSLKNKQT